MGPLRKSYRTPVFASILIITRFQVPYMIAGQSICAIGTGLLIRLRISTSTAEWATYLVISGIGLGMGMQLPFTAVQVVLQ